MSLDSAYLGEMRWYTWYTSCGQLRRDEEKTIKCHSTMDTDYIFWCQVVRPALLYGAETWATTRGQEARLKVYVMTMLRRMCKVTWSDTIRNEYNRGTTRVVQSFKKITETRLKWYGHVMRMKEEHIVRKMLDVDIPGKRRRGRQP